jgi:hypothetical protein
MDYFANCFDENELFLAKSPANNFKTEQHNQNKFQKI